MGRIFAGFALFAIIMTMFWMIGSRSSQEVEPQAQERSRADEVLELLRQSSENGGNLQDKLPPPPVWSVTKWKSKMDDSPAVLLTSESEEMVSGRFGGAGPATLMLRCLENTTNLLVKVNDHFLADIQSYGNVRYRIDDRQAATLRMRESTDNEALGLWSGGQAIPVIRRMFGHDQVTMQITPFNQSPVTVTFPITGLQEEIQPLRQACHW